jgi:tetratricopeptide (TPR) repeat protein
LSAGKTAFGLFAGEEEVFIMPKSRHKKRKQKSRPGSLLSNVGKDLERIDALIEDGDLPEALLELKKMSIRAPHRAEVFENIFFVAMQLDDKLEMLNACLRLTELQPHVPAHHFNLYGVYMQNLLPALAMQTGKYFLSRWPDLELGKDISKELAALDALLKDEALKSKFPEDGWLEHIVLHERVQVATIRHRYKEAQEAATELITRAPRFAPAYNNRSLAYWAGDEREAAIADARQALEIDPENVHALGNLTRFLRLTNSLTEAESIAARLKAADVKSPDAWTKKAEAFSYLCDDATVLQIAEQADKAGALFGDHADPILLHLAGVAAARRGDEKKAKRFWEEAVKRSPSFHRAQAQLDDLDKPPGERNGPWPFELEEWISRRAFDDLKSLTQSKHDKTVRAAVDRYVAEHPQVKALIPVLLERGDPGARELAIRLAQFSQHPELQEALKIFALSSNGPDRVRREAANALTEMGVLLRGQAVRMWWGGEQRELMMSNYRIDHEPYEKLPPKAQEMSVMGFEALSRHDADRAEEFFSKALAFAPGSASMLFNLAMVNVNRGNVREAREELEMIAAQHPKYAFAQCELAMIALANDRKEEARRLLDGLAALDHYHMQEFAALSRTNALYCVVAESSHEGAQRWLDMWEELLPDDPKLDLVRPIVDNKFFSVSHAKRLLLRYRE